MWETITVTAGEEINRGAVYIGADGKLYNSPPANKRTNVIDINGRKAKRDLSDRYKK